MFGDDEEGEASSATGLVDFWILSFSFVNAIEQGGFSIQRVFLLTLLIGHGPKGRLVVIYHVLTLIIIRKFTTFYLRPNVQNPFHARIASTPRVSATSLCF